jgi:ribosomal protein S7
MINDITDKMTVGRLREKIVQRTGIKDEQITLVYNAIQLINSKFGQNTMQEMGIEPDSTLVMAIRVRGGQK